MARGLRAIRLGGTVQTFGDAQFGSVDHTPQPAQRLLACWAMDLLSLRRRGLLVPDWERLASASTRGGLCRPPAPEVATEQASEAA